jgi:hypothetical protein
MSTEAVAPPESSSPTTPAPPPDADPGLPAPPPPGLVRAWFDAADAVTQIQTDRFCFKCAYNLLGQAVRREPCTGTPMVCCPECGTLQPVTEGRRATTTVLRRFGLLLLFIHIGIVLSVLVTLGSAQVGMTIGAVEELTYRDYSQRPVIVTIKDFGRDDLAMLAAMRITLGAMGLVAFTFAVSAFHHWPKWLAMLFAFAIPASVAAICWIVFSVDQPSLSIWSMPIIAYHGVAVIVGGLLGCIFGRPIMRLLIIALVPRRMRWPLAPLWIVDGKQLRCEPTPEPPAPRAVPAAT